MKYEDFIECFMLVVQEKAKKKNMKKHQLRATNLFPREEKESFNILIIKIKWNKIKLGFDFIMNIIIIVQVYMRKRGCVIWLRYYM